MSARFPNSFHSKEEGMISRMSKYLIAVLALTVLSGWGWSKGYESQKSAGNNTVTLRAEKYPLIKGDNSISVEITDQAKKPVANAGVKVRYYMPPMPGMAPMAYDVQPVKKGDAHIFSANIPMEGVWKLEVSVVDAGGAESSAIFNLDAR
jgi:nitrogen fixation protein FixH